MSDFSSFPFLALIYIIFHPVGKIIGIYYGTILINQEVTIKDNLGLGLLAQGGVVIGLASLASNIFHEADYIILGEFILATIVISTILTEIISSFFTKHTVRRSEKAKITQLIKLINFKSDVRSIEYN